MKTLNSYNVSYPKVFDEDSQHPLKSYIDQIPYQTLPALRGQKQYSQSILIDQALRWIFNLFFF